jgi:hypothetical protein
VHPAGKKEITRKTKKKEKKEKNSAKKKDKAR